MSRVEPNPVTYSGTPIGIAACRDLPHTWFYEQLVYSNVGGNTFTITERENFFDGNYVSTIGERLEIGPNGSVRISSRWCSGNRVVHYAQTRFKGKDANGKAFTISGPVVQLLPTR